MFSHLVHTLPCKNAKQCRKNSLVKCILCGLFVQMPCKYDMYMWSLQAGLLAANSLLGKGFSLRKNPKYMILSWPEAGARILVTRFLQRFIVAGCLMWDFCRILSSFGFYILHEAAVNFLILHSHPIHYVE